MIRFVFKSRHLSIWTNLETLLTSSSVRPPLPKRTFCSEEIPPNIEKRGKKKRIVDYVQVQGEVLYGINSVLLALEAEQRTFHQIYYNEQSKRTQKIIEIAEFRGIPCQKVERYNLNTLAKHSDKEVGVHQGVCADVSKLLPKIFQASDLNDGDYNQLILFLCGLSDPFNSGAVLRSAYFLGADRVLTSSFKTHSSPLTPVVSKTSSGILEIFTPQLVRHPEVFLESVQEKGNWTVMATGLPNDEQNHQVVSKDGNVTVLDTGNFNKDSNPSNIVLLIGNEGIGIPPEILRFCDKTLVLGPHRSGIWSVVD